MNQRLLLKLFVVWNNIRDQVSDQLPLGQRLDRHRRRFQFDHAGVFHFTVDERDAGLTGVGIDAAITNGERAVSMNSDPAQRVEQRHAVFIRHFKIIEARRLTERTTLNAKPRH